MIKMVVPGTAVRLLLATCLLAAMSGALAKKTKATPCKQLFGPTKATLLMFADPGTLSRAII